MQVPEQANGDAMDVTYPDDSSDESHVVPETANAEIAEITARLRRGEPAGWPERGQRCSYSRELDALDPLRHLRKQFLIPSTDSYNKTKLEDTVPDDFTGSESEERSATYLSGNSLGVQPKAVRRYIDNQLETWASIGVHGHSRLMENSPLMPWLDMAERCSRQTAPLVGAQPHEIIYMNSLSVNLHLMMFSFYKPEGRKTKILCEWRPFPSDFYVIESQLRIRGMENITDHIITVRPVNEDSYLSTADILQKIEANSGELALILLPGVQYYTGQVLDMARITAFARNRRIPIGWDLAHAVGNVELSLHDWDVDFACWCSYKYLNAGPGAISGVFVHDRHGQVQPRYRPRLTGWYGHERSTRFDMDNIFRPTPGAAGYQISNPSAMDLAILSAALTAFEHTSMKALRDKSLLLTSYTEHLLELTLAKCPQPYPPFRIITPRDARERGAQLSLLFHHDWFDVTAECLERHSIACDKRKPNVIRVAPVALYNNFKEVDYFVNVVALALGSRFPS
ncbi:kynureninase [Piedraia hortae CBS 480.64]|uniref:Kynureninase n=1 Tax=Piedraia hortae CBS 480.64 TaxID=1314780 RepID=A0A6A7BSS5_9PEZI|nr:kynureninase [Piedraia hortae CBS 480.64]